MLTDGPLGEAEGERSEDVAGAEGGEDEGDEARRRLGNSGDAALAPVAEHLIGDSSPLVRGMAVWAARRLLDAEAFQRLKSARLPREGEPSVAEEWDQ